MKKLIADSSLKLFLYFLNLYKIRIYGLFLLSALMGLTPVIDSFLLSKITDLIEANSDTLAERLLESMFFMAIIYSLWWEGLNIIYRVYEYLYLTTITKLKGRVLDELYNYVQHYEHQFFQNNLVGSIVARIAEGSRSIEMVFCIFNEQMLRKFAMVIFAIVAMYTVHYILALIFFIWVTVFLSISLFYAKYIHKNSHNYADKKSEVTGKLVDAISNISVIRIFNLYKSERKYLKRDIENVVSSEQKLQWFMLKLYYGLGLSCSIMIFAIIYYVIKLKSDLLISVGDCVLVLTLCVSVVDDIYDLTQELGELFYEFGAFAQSMSLIQPYTITDVENAQDLKISTGTIEFSKVSFYYDDHKIFNNKSIIIEGGQQVGLVGFSGSGKTTFVSLIYRLYDIVGGTILIDGQDISKVTQESLRANISIIPQETILFHRTIMENIRYGNQNASDDEVIKAAKLAHIDEFITSLPKTYQTLCGEGGSNFSGGQKQRIAIARAILKNAPILILDEATSSLDSNTEKLIQESLKYLMKNKTVIIIAHRLTTLLNVNKILVFKNGKLLETGSHKELIEQNNMYSSLWKAQTGIVV